MRPVRIAVPASLAVVIVALGAFLLLTRHGGDEQASAPSSYYFEARLDVSNRSPTDPLLDVIRAWFKAPNKWRREISSSDPRQQDKGSVQVSDGETVSYFDGRSNTYYSLPYADELRDPLRMFGTSFMIGPLPANSIEDFAESRQQAGNVLVRKGKLAKRTVQIVEARLSGGQTATTWIEPKHLFTLKYELISPNRKGENIAVEVIDSKFNQPIPDSRFRFEPPASARPQNAPAQTGTTSLSVLGPLGSRQVTFPQGFLSPSYTPPGYVTTRVQARSSASSGASNQAAIAMRLQPGGQLADSGPYLEIEQYFRAGGLPDLLKTGTAVKIGGRDAYRSENGIETVLTWAAGDLVVTIKSNALPFADLMKIGESMQ